MKVVVILSILSYMIFATSGSEITIPDQEVDEQHNIILGRKIEVPYTVSVVYNKLLTSKNINEVLKLKKPLGCQKLFDFCDGILYQCCDPYWCSKPVVGGQCQ